MLESDAEVRPLKSPAYHLPPGFVRAAVLLSLGMTLAVLYFGAERSQVFGQGLWPPLLRAQALVLLELAAVITAIGVWGPSGRKLRGWPALAIVGGLSTTAICGLGATLALAVIAWCSLIAGEVLLLIADPEGRLDLSMVFVTGLGTIMLVLVSASILHVPMTPVYWLLLAAAMVCTAFSRALHGVLRERLARAVTLDDQWTVSRTLVVWLSLFAWLFYAANAALPERLWDPLVAHLLIPMQMLAFGHWSYDFSQFAFAFFPAGADNLFGFAMALGGEQAAKLVNLLLLGAILLTLHGAFRTFCTAPWAELGLLMFLSLPVALLSTAAAMAENALALFAIATFRALLLMRDDRLRRSALLVLCVTGPGLAAVKLHGMVLAGICAIIIFLQVRYRQLTARDLTMIGSLAVVTVPAGLSQYAYAYLRTGNPVFPLMNEIFKSPHWPAAPFEDVRWQGHLTWDFLYQVTFYSSRFLEADNGAAGFVLLGLFLPGVIATVLSPRAAPVIALIIAGIYTAVVASQLQYIRYLYPVMPLFLIAGLYGLTRVDNRLGARVAGACGALFAILGFLVLPSGAWTLRSADLRAVYDPIARHALVLRQVPVRVATQTINAIGLDDPRVIYGGEPYGALLRGTPIYTAWYNRALHDQLTAASNAEEIAAALDAQHADFVVAAPTSIDPLEQKVVAYAERDGTRIASLAAVTVWRVGRTQRPDMAHTSAPP